MKNLNLIFSDLDFLEGSFTDEVEILLRWAGRCDPKTCDSILRLTDAYVSPVPTSLRLSWFHIDIGHPVEAEVSRWILKNTRCSLCQEEFWDQAIILMSVPSLCVHKTCVMNKVPLCGQELQDEIVRILESR